MPAVTGITAERRTLAEAVRAAILTVHAAAGLASCADQQTQRLLRASEGLSRSALAVLLAAPPDASPQQPRAPRPDDAPRRRRRPRGKRGHRGQKATAMDEDVTTELEPSGGARASGPAAAAPGVPRRALVASGETETGTLSNSTGTLAMRLPFRTTRKAPESANAQSDLEDEWADGPGARRVAPRLLQPDGGPGSAVVAPPTHSGTRQMIPAGGPRLGQLLTLLGRVRDINPAVNEFFVRFNSLGLLKHTDFDPEKGDKAMQLCDDI